MSLPSHFLPLLNPPPSPLLLSLPLARLETLLAPPRIVSLLEGDTPSDDPERLDEFETKFVRGWVERVVALGMREMGKDGGGEGLWEDAVERAASLLAMLAGHCSAGASTRTFVLPCFLPPLDAPTALLTPPPSRPSSALSPSKTPSLPPPLFHALPIEIRDTTLLESGTGFRTWGAATLLARRISLSPSTFFPLPSLCANSSFNQEPLKVIELGSGTGLVGLTVAAVLARLHRTSSVLLTDFDTDALANLSHNVLLNQSILGEVAVRKLDWATATTADEGRHDVVFAADCVYEPAHAELVHRAVSQLLAFPTLGQQETRPTCWVVLPLRRTHEAEHNAFDRVFDGGRERADGEEGVDEGGGRWRLEKKERVEESGRDGFGEKGDGVSMYWVYRIEWKAVA